MMIDARRKLVLGFLLGTLGIGLGGGAWAQTPSSSPQLADRVIAIVDSEPILLSDLEREIESYQFEAQSLGREVTEDPAEIRRLMLDRLIEVKLLVAQAKVDGISIEDEELDQAVAADLQEIIDRFGTRAELDRELDRIGMTFKDLETRHRELNRDRFYTSNMINLHIRPNVEVMDFEVREFYEQNRDQVPAHATRITLANILIVPQLAPDQRESMAGRLRAIEEELDRGVAFEEVARKHSEGPNANRGGLVGTFARGDLFSPVLEEVAWEMSIGDVSDPVQTEIGIHYVQVTGKTENEITLRQIMLRIELTADDREAARTRAAEVVRAARGGQDFGELARIHSDDPSTRDKGGLLGSFTAEQLSPQFLEAIRGLEVGGVTDAVEGSAGLFVLKLLDRQDGAVYTFEEVEDRLRQILMEQKIEGELKEFISGLREEFFIEIKA